MINKTYTIIRHKEDKNVFGYIHSKNPDGTFNICFRMREFSPSPKHLYRHTPEYLDNYYLVHGETKWNIQ